MNERAIDPHAHHDHGDAHGLHAPVVKAETAPEGSIYTCPICGMALEPLLATAETTRNPELIDFTRRFWIGTLLTVPVVALEMGGHLAGLHRFLGQQTANWLQFVLGTPVVLW